jgi:CHASE3 domain sensor protein
VSRVEGLQQTAQQKFTELEETISLKKAGKDKEALTLVLSNKGKQVMDDMRSKLATMGEEEEKLLAERVQASGQVQLVSSVAGWGGLIIGIGAGLFVSYYVANYITRLIIGPITDAAKAGSLVFSRYC